MWAAIKTRYGHRSIREIRPGARDINIGRELHLILKAYFLTSNRGQFGIHRCNLNLVIDAAMRLEVRNDEICVSLAGERGWQYAEISCRRTFFLFDYVIFYRKIKIIENVYGVPAFCCIQCFWPWKWKW